MRSRNVVGGLSIGEERMERNGMEEEEILPTRQKPPCPPICAQEEDETGEQLKTSQPLKKTVPTY
jgi:hypothetical protein